MDASLPRLVEDLLTRYQVSATSLVLEVTETALLREPDRSLAVVEALRALGAQVSIDDFGTGYSSLTQLRQLPVSELKLDRSFTVDLLTDPRAPRSWPTPSPWPTICSCGWSPRAWMTP